MDIPKSYIDDFPVFFTFNSCDFHHCPGLPHVSYLSIHNISHFKDIRSESIWLDRNYSHFSINNYIASGSRVNISSRYDCSRARFKLLSLIHISEPTRRTPISYAVFCLKKKKKKQHNNKKKK